MCRPCFADTVSRVIMAFVLVGAVLSVAGEGLARPPDGPGLSGRIDGLIEKFWKIDDLTPAPLSGDAEFFRRVNLDLAGRIPARQEAADFLDDTAPDKRARAIARLLESPDFARHFSTVILNWLIPRQPKNNISSREDFRKWLETRLAERQSWRSIAHDIIVASGSADKNPQISFLLANGPTPQDAAAETSRLFLGVQIQCAQCHDHPFTDWKREDFWELAAFYSQVRKERTKSKQNALTDAPGKSRGRSNGENRQPPQPSIRIPDTKTTVAGQFLDGSEAEVPKGTPFRIALADWVTSPENPYFAQAMVNRVWGYLFGRGFVNPVDNFLPDEDPSHPELLDVLSREFTASDFDLRFLLGAITGTRTYQLTSRADGDPPVAQSAGKIDAEEEEEESGEGQLDEAMGLFAQRTLRALSPEQFYDSVSRATGVVAKAPAPKKGRRVTSARDRVVAILASAENPDAAATYEGSIPLTLYLMNSSFINNRKIPSVEKIVAGRSDRPPDRLLDELFLTALSRRPDAAEGEEFLRFLRESEDPGEAARSIFWSLLNSSEFALNH